MKKFSFSFLYSFLSFFFSFSSSMYRLMKKRGHQLSDHSGKKVNKREESRGTLAASGMTPAEMIRMVDAGKITRPDRELPVNAKKAGLDPTSKHYGLMAASLFPAKNKLEFTSEKFNFLLEKPAGNYIPGVAFTFQHLQVYDFNVEWDRGWTRKTVDASKFTYPKRGETLQLRQAMGKGLPPRHLNFKVVKVDIPPGNLAIFGVTLRFEK